MVPPSDDDSSDARVTRRGYLAAAGAGLAATGLAGAASAQVIRRRVVIPGEEDRFENYNQNIFLHVIESTETTLDIKEFEKCDFANWKPESTTAYRTQLIDTRQNSPEPVETNAFVNQTAAQAEHALQPGSLYIINQEVDCPGRYVGLKVEFLTGRTPSVDEGQGTPAGTTQSNGAGPGFGALGALGALGAGALARAWRRD